ncbi:hypothetical protein [Mucilaginibacter sp. CSA2-8R]|uniref:hypothetical protein n=1 Tax=Mucilaginibacter sp. CSA2-8R TaxID=3141542 RepID=UPI00315D0DAA
MDALLSPTDIQVIVEWADAQTPVPEVEFTNLRPGIGADGVLVQFDNLTVDQANQLLELRRRLDCHVSIGNQKNLDQVVFNRLYPYNLKIDY